MNYSVVRQKSFPYTKEDGLKCLSRLQVDKAKQEAKGKRVPSASSRGYRGTDTPTHTSSPPCKTYAVVNQLCEGAVGGPTAPFFL